MRENRTAGPPGRDLVRVAFGPSLVAMVIIAAVVLLRLLIANSDMTGAFGAIASIWLAVHQVPISIGGRELRRVPAAAGAADGVGRGPRHRGRGPVGQASWFVLRWIVASRWAARCCSPRSHWRSSTTPHRFWRGCGRRMRCGRSSACCWCMRSGGYQDGIAGSAGESLADVSAPPWLPDAIRAAVAGVLALFGLSGAVTALSLVVHWSTMHDLFGITDSLFGQLSLTILSILYAPT